MSIDKQNCGNCKYYRPENPEMGTCRRFPPQRGFHAVDSGPSRMVGATPNIMLVPDCNFMLTQPPFWCGEWQESDGNASEGTA